MSRGSHGSFQGASGSNDLINATIAGAEALVPCYDQIDFIKSLGKLWSVDDGSVRGYSTDGCKLHGLSALV